MRHINSGAKLNSVSLHSFCFKDVFTTLRSFWEDSTKKNRYHFNNVKSRARSSDFSKDSEISQSKCDEMWISSVLIQSISFRVGFRL